MTAKEFLKQYENATKIVKRLRREYERELSLIDSIKVSSDLDGMPHGSGISKPAEEKAIRLADKFAAWKIAEIDALEKRQEVFDAIYRIKAPEGDVLIERYINLKSWGDVSKAVGYTERQVYNIHGNALQIVKEIIKFQ